MVEIITALVSTPNPRGWVLCITGRAIQDPVITSRPLAQTESEGLGENC